MNNSDSKLTKSLSKSQSASQKNKGRIGSIQTIPDPSGLSAETGTGRSLVLS